MYCIIVVVRLFVFSNLSNNCMKMIIFDVPRHYKYVLLKKQYSLNLPVCKFLYIACFCMFLGCMFVCVFFSRRRIAATKEVGCCKTWSLTYVVFIMPWYKHFALSHHHNNKPMRIITACILPLCVLQLGIVFGENIRVP